MTEASPPPRFEIPERFEVLEEIGRSENEVLLRARDRVLFREVMLKHPCIGFAARPNAAEIARSLREARSLARVRHPGVARLLDVIETQTGPLLVMEPVAGETLAERLARERRLSPEDVRVLALRLAEALEAIHTAGVVYRGISASHIVLRADGTPCLTGFVFAKFDPSGAAHSVGTTFLYKHSPRDEGEVSTIVEPPHPAPEQVHGQAADARSDIFGLGWVLYECLTAEVPYPLEIGVEHWTAPADMRSNAPRALCAVILKCLQPSPLKRFENATALRAALAAIPAANTTLDAAAATRSARSRRVRASWIGGAAVAVLVAGWIAKSTVNGGDAQLATTDERSLDRGLALARNSAVVFSDRYAQSHALLIGIGSAYEAMNLPPLQNAENDIEAIHKRLDEMPWEHWAVEELKGEQATHDRILASLANLAERTRADDRVFIYYAGHGEAGNRSEKRAWIIPAGGKSTAEDPGRGTWVAFDEFFHFFDDSLAKHILIAMDCCYGGRLAQSRSTASVAFHQKFLTQKAHIVISSGRANERVSDGVAGETSPFARAFLHALATPGVEAVTTTMVFDKIHQEFMSISDQNPQIACPANSPSQGEFVFFLRKPD